MKDFQQSDIQNGAIVASRDELIHAPLPWQLKGLSETASGYGGKLTTEHKISFCGKQYRIYCACYGNSGSLYFNAKGQRISVSA